MKGEVICSFPVFVLFCSVLGLAILIPQGILLGSTKKTCDCDALVDFNGYGYLNKTDNRYFKYLIGNATRTIDIIISEAANCTYFNPEVTNLLLLKQHEGVEIRLISTFDIENCEFTNRKLQFGTKNMHIFMAIADDLYFFMPTIADLDKFNDTNYFNNPDFFHEHGYANDYEYFTNYTHLYRYNILISNCQSLMLDAHSLFEYFWKMSEDSNKSLTNTSVSGLDSTFLPDISFPKIHRLRDKCRNDDFYDYDPIHEPFFFEFLFSPSPVTHPGRRSLLDEIMKIIDESEPSDVKIFSSEIFPSMDVQTNNQKWKDFEKLISKFENQADMFEAVTSREHYQQNFERFDAFQRITPSFFYTVKMYKESVTYVMGNETVIMFPGPFTALFDDNEFIMGCKIADSLVASDVIYIFLRQHKQLFYTDGPGSQMEF